MEMNAESVLDALNDFERKPTEIPPILEDYLLRIAQNGEIIFPWGKLKPLLKRKLEIVLDEFYKTCPLEITVPVSNFQTFNFDSLKNTILSAVDAFGSAPFTIQRICELVTNPKKHYNRTDKYMRGIEKNVLVVSTIEPRIGVQNDGNANVNPIVNGMIEESPHGDDCFNGHDNNENEASSNLNSSSNHVLLDNFANVFPSAACIPSPSDVCIGRDVETISQAVDSNFLPGGSECIESQEAGFEASVPMDSENSAGEEAKVEQMDTSPEEDDEPSSEAAKNEELLAESAQPPSTEEKIEASEVEKEKDAENSDETETTEQLEQENIETEQPEVYESNVVIETEVISDMETKSDDDFNAAGDAPNEAESVSSESCNSEDLEPATSDAKPQETGEQCQQDDTVSQSDETVSKDSDEVSQSDNAVVQEAAQNGDSSPGENVPAAKEESSNEKVSQSVEKV